MYYLGLTLIVLAGIFNGSFIVPARNVKSISNEMVWVFHSIIGFVIVSWLLLIVFFPHSFRLYGLLHIHEVMLLIVSGVVFGLGQICFAYAIETIGIALSFTVNLGLGVTLGTMFVILYKSSLWTAHGKIATIAVALIIISLFIYYKAGKNNQGRLSQRKLISASHYKLGWLLAVFAGFSSGLQNISFVIVAYHSSAMPYSENSYWYWPAFLTFAAIPMLIGFLYRAKQQGYLGQYRQIYSTSNFAFITLMGVFFSGSLVLYSLGMSRFSNAQQVTGWPTLMSSIILASQAWGWFFGEAKLATLKHKRYMVVSILLLLTAILLIGLSQ
ncbi:MAG: hypothetical protein COV52_01760 [Gammaproteobacteria bacterium CG11_big_fil_rev_8_21_14_0_20_46_22]|nr:MAG: hypothetical protein COW05_05655 [Gammaproteobacteria bacterium CG12_big_fil_rev_8_21_14_0_65_46_12]PIR11840.1 MAG: hypothetical protein COV52_01760 [Gammaproteobacteria bacterium CG11_big_fil_rev_8_21_14_0_20_46_22]